MPRLTREQSQKRTRERLLDAAEEIFAREGYAAASVEQIAEHANYSKGAIYSNFENKEALFLALLARHMERDQEALRDIASSSVTASDILDSLSDRFRIFEKKLDLCLLTTEFQIEACRRQEVADRFAELFRIQRRELANLLKVFFEKAGTALPVRAEDLATVIMAMAGGLALHRAADPKSVPRGLLTKSMQLFLVSLLRAGREAARTNAKMKGTLQDHVLERQRLEVG